MSAAPIRKEQPARVASAQRRGSRTPGPGSYLVRRTPSGIVTPSAGAGWIYNSGVYIDAALTSTLVTAGSSASVPYSGFSTHGTTVGCAAGTGQVDVTGSGLFLLFLSVTATGGGSTGSIRLTVGGVVLSAPVIGPSAIFQGWVEFPNDGGSNAVGPPFVENAGGADVTVSGDVNVYPALSA